MLNQPNTIYEIRYDFDLNGENIEIPEGCTLKFEGGSLKNGTIKGNETIIFAESYWIFKHVNIQSCIANIAYPEWFGAISSNNFIRDNSISINATLNAFNTVCFNDGVYYISNPIYVNRDKIKLFGRGNTTIKASDSFNIITDDSITKLDSYYDFHNSLICCRPGTYKDSYNITTDLIHEFEINNLRFDASSIVDIGIEIWALLGNIHDIIVQNTTKKAVLIRRGWNNRFSNIRCYNNDGDGIEVGSEANSTLLSRIVIDHFGEHGLILNSGTNIIVQNINIEIGKNIGILISNKVYNDLKNVCTSYADTNVGSVVISGVWMENFSADESIGIKISNSDGVIVQGAYFNQIYRPFFIGGSLRRGYIIYPFNNYCKGKSHLGYINNRFKGSECNIIIYDDKKNWDYDNNIECTQASFIRNSESGAIGFSGINIGRFIGNLRSQGDFEYDYSYDDLVYYTEQNDSNEKAKRVTSWNRMAQKIKGITFEAFCSNGIIIVYAYGTATEYFKGDVSFDNPIFNYGTKTYVEDFEKYDESSAIIENRTYNAFFLECKTDDIIKRKLIYPVYSNRVI